MALTDSEKNKLKKLGLKGLNKPKMTPSHPTKKAVVAVREDNGKLKTIRFGAQGMGHNYSKEARSNFKARHGKNIARGKTSAAYWADKVVWGGKGKSTKRPHRVKNRLSVLVARTERKLKDGDK